MAFFGSLIQYVVTMIIMAVLAFAGLMVGRKLRKMKDAKASVAKSDEAKE